MNKSDIFKASRGTDVATLASGMEVEVFGISAAARQRFMKAMESRPDEQIFWYATLARDGCSALADSTPEEIMEGMTDGDIAEIGIAIMRLSGFEQAAAKKKSGTTKNASSTG